MHDMSMLYTFILWGVLFGIVLGWITVRGWRMGGPAQNVGNAFDKICDQLKHFKRRRLIIDIPMRWLLERVSRLHVLILACLSAHLLIFS
jgi:ferric-chelate reductase